MTTESPQPTTPAVRTVGDYRLVRLLGEGGAAHTFVGEDSQTGRTHAVKELRLLKSSNPKQIELFERECSVLGEIDHPQIPHYVDAVVERRDETLSLFLVQELIEGQSLQQLFDTGHRFDANDVVAIMRSCLVPLGYLHDRQPPLFHRDIKPSNVIRRDDGTCVLVDFGAVREAVLDNQSGGGSSIVGTFGFQARANAATDLYGLGATALHLLSGVEPARFPLHRLKPDIRAHLNTDPALAGILDRLLEPASEDRFQTAGELDAMLAEWQRTRAERPADKDEDDAAQDAPTTPLGHAAALAVEAAAARRPRDESGARRRQQLERSTEGLQVRVVDEEVNPAEAFVPGRQGAREVGSAVALAGVAVGAIGALGPLSYNATAWMIAGTALVAYGLLLTLMPRAAAGRNGRAAASGVATDVHVDRIVRRRGFVGRTEWIVDFHFVGPDELHYGNRFRLPNAKVAREVATNPGRIRGRYAANDPTEAILVLRR